MSNLFEKLSEEFPKEALSEDKSRGFEMTAINAQYVVERLNKVLGVNGWSSSYDFFTEGEGNNRNVISVCTLTLNTDKGPITRTAVGAAPFMQRKKDYKTGQFEYIPKLVGDVYKSAMTDSLGKAASHLGVGNSVFKGLINPDGSTKSGKSAPKKTYNKKASSKKATTSAPTEDNPFAKPPASQPSFNPENVKKAETTAGAANPFA